MLLRAARLPKHACPSLSASRRGSVALRIKGLSGNVSTGPSNVVPARTSGGQLNRTGRHMTFSTGSRQPLGLVDPSPIDLPYAATSTQDLSASPSPSSGLPDHAFLGQGDLGARDDYAHGEDVLAETREERRSPAAVLGTKRIGLVVLPDHLCDAIQKEIHLIDPREVREHFLQLNPSTSTRSTTSRRLEDKRIRNTPASALAKAAAFLPGEYAAVRNVLQEVRQRLGRDQWRLDGKGKEAVEVSGTIGAGIWALADLLSQDGSEETVKYTFANTSRSGTELAGRLFESLEPGSLHIDIARETPSSTNTPVFLAMSTFQLSSLPTRAARLSHLRQLLALNPLHTVLVDRSTPAGWSAISEARTFLLSQSTASSPLHTLAPCPHDGACPLVEKRDPCGFSQRLQRPPFLRRTKHAQRGEEDIGYSYYVLSRGERPSTRETGEGRIGGVGREEAEKARRKVEGKSVLTEVEGGEYEMVPMAIPGTEAESDVTSDGDVQRKDAVVAHEEMRTEAYNWPRLVAPPIKRSGHVIMDTCHPSGDLQRMTFAKSHSKQGYHDARKATWGDLFPHEPKGKEVKRDRGVRRLLPVTPLLGEDGDLSAHEASWPVAELSPEGPMDAERGDNVTIWRSGEHVGRNEQRIFGSDRRKNEPHVIGRRQFSSSAPRYSVHLPEGASTAAGSDSPARSKVTIAELYRLFRSKTPVTCLTAYDYPTALLSERGGIDMCLIGDSLSQVCLGHSSTTRITLDEMIHHASAVTRGARTPFVFADLPFGSFEVSVEQGVASVIRMMKEAQVDGVKIEGGMEIVPLVKRLTSMGIPVMPHLGLQPQRAVSLSGYRVQAKEAESAADLVRAAKAMKEAGAFGVLLEAIPHSLAQYITESLDILTIGIGAGKGTAGQVLVVTDVLGTFAKEGDWKAKFVRHFGNQRQESEGVVTKFKGAIYDGSFPTREESYGMKKEEWERFLQMQQAGSAVVEEKKE